MSASGLGRAWIPPCSDCKLLGLKILFLLVLNHLLVQNLKLIWRCVKGAQATRSKNSSDVVFIIYNPIHKFSTRNSWQVIFMWSLWIDDKCLFSYFLYLDFFNNVQVHKWPFRNRYQSHSDSSFFINIDSIIINLLLSRLFPIAILHFNPFL